MLQETILEIPFTRCTMAEATNLCLSWLNSAPKVARTVAFVNPHSVQLTLRDAAFRSAIQASDAVFADGIGVIIASRILKRGLRERICGPDFFTEFSAVLEAHRPRTRVFFLGTDRRTLEKMRLRYSTDFPGLTCCGVYAPPFRREFSPMDILEMRMAIDSANPELLWVGLGAPKQEVVSRDLVVCNGVKLICPIGGVFDFYTGNVSLPPWIIQRIGLIWLWRLCQEPRRLFRRNLDAPVFISRAIMERLRSMASRLNKDN